MARQSFVRRPAPALAEEPRQARALTAAGARIDPANTAQVKRVTQEPRDWQLRALAYYDELGEVRYGARWMGDAISRLRVIPAYQEGPTEPPVPLELAERPDSELAAANAAIARLASGAESGIQGILRALAINVWLVGESYLVGYATEVGESWEVASVEALVAAPSGGLALRTSPSVQLQDALIPLPPDDSVVIQVLRRHPRWRDWPDAAMRGALEYCEDLSLLTRMIRATASSRVPAGMLFIPDEASFGSANPGDADGDLDRDPLTEDLLRHMTEPIRTPGDAAAVVPFVLRMSRADIAAVRLEQLDRPIDSLAVQLREEARRSLAAVLDLPAEILAGKGDLNHWTAWQVDAEAFAIHVEPLAALILDALSTEYYQPALDAAGVENPGRHRLWYDPSGLVSAPDGVETAFKLYDRGEISGEALRAAVGVGGGEAPDEAELARRRELADVIGVRKPQAAPAGAPPGPAGPPGLIQGPPAGASVLEPLALAEGTPPALLAAQAPAAAHAPLRLPAPEEVAPSPGQAPRSADLEPLGAALAQIDRELRLRVQLAADELVRRALERAGNRLRSLANRDRSGLASRSLQAVSSHEVGATLGPALIKQLGTSAGELAEGALEPLHARYSRWMLQAFDGVLALLEPWRLPGYDPEPARARLRESSEEGWQLLSAAADALVAERLLSPLAAPPEQGEYDDSVLLAPGLIRQSIQTAWGGPLRPALSAAIPGPLASELVGGLITSEMLYDMMGRAADLVLNGNGWRWSYGSALTRVTTFEPHLRLDGTAFTDWEDPALRNPSGGWPAEFLYPGDHLWCQCDVVPLVGPAVPDISLARQSRLTELDPGLPHLRLNPQFSADPQVAAREFAEWAEHNGLAPPEFSQYGLTEGQVERFLAGGSTPEDLQQVAELMARAQQEYGPTLRARSAYSMERAQGQLFVTVDSAQGDALAFYNTNSGRINLVPGASAGADEGFAYGFLAQPGLSGSLAHELGHHVGFTFIGSAEEQWQLMSSAVERVLADRPDLVDEVLGLRRRLETPGFGSRTRNALQSLLSDYAGSRQKGEAYASLNEHHGGEGFAELFSVFFNPGGCAALEASPVRGALRLEFARALRAEINAGAGWDVIPDCS